LGPVQPVEPGTRVGRLEVFFDVVFVFGFFQIARFVTRDLEARTLIEGALVLALLWLCWIAHMLAAHRVLISEGFAPLVTFAAMAAVLAVALTIPHAFGPMTGGLYGPLLFPACYLAIRVVHLWLHWHVARNVPAERRQLVRLTLATVVSTGLLFLAAALPFHFEAFNQFGVRAGLWTLAVLVEYGTGMAIGLSGWQVKAPQHYAERFELIVIIALGESIISIGVGSEVIGRPITWPDLLAAVLVILVIATLWWAYFDLVGPAAELALRGSEDRALIALARDGYIYLHLPMIAGLILFAIGAEEALRYANTVSSDPFQPLHGLGTCLLFAGLALYFASLAAFQLRALGTLLWSRVAVIVLLIAIAPIAGRLPSAVVVGLLVGICVALVTVETIVYDDSRHALREAVRHER